MIFIIFIIFIINMSLVPESFLCPITRNIMNNPYIDNDGNTYEYSAIFEWLKQNNTSPITRNYIELSHLKPNRSLLELINSHVSGNLNINSIVSNPSVFKKNNDFKLKNNILNLNIQKYIIDEYSYFQLNINIIDTENNPSVDIVVFIDISELFKFGYS